MIDHKEFNLVSQLSHFAWGALLPLVALKFGGTKWAWIIFLASIPVYGFKEFYLDFKYETPEVRGSSLEDFVFQVLGGAIGVFLATR